MGRPAMAFGSFIGRTGSTRVRPLLKRTTQMSGDLQPFELIYMPKGLPVELLSDPCPVEEEWEKYRHQYVHLHRKIILTSVPLTVKQDQYQIFVGQGDDKLH